MNPGSQARQRRHIRDLIGASKTVRRAIVATLVIVVVLLLATCVALFLQERKDAAALGKAAQVQHRLQAEAVGECFRVNYFRWQEDLWRYASWRRDTTSAYFLAHGISHAVRTLSGVFAAASLQERFLPYTDCRRATRSPLGYRPPTAVSFTAFSRARIVALLDHPHFHAGGQRDPTTRIPVK